MAETKKEEIAPALMRVKQVAQYMSCSPQHVLNLVKRGELHEPVKLGCQCVVWRKEWVDEYIDRVVPKD